MPAAIVMRFRVLSADGATVILDCTEANGYQVVSLEPLERRHRSVILTDDDAEGGVVQQQVLDMATYGAVIRCLGSSQSQAVTRRQSLVDAVERRRWRAEFTIAGVVETFEASKADTSTTRDWIDAHRNRRHVQLRIPVQPRSLEEL